MSKCKRQKVEYRGSLGLESQGRMGNNCLMGLRFFFGDKNVLELIVEMAYNSENTPKKSLSYIL
jgi:hypothetical protein